MNKKTSGKIGVLLVNLGTPDTPNTPDVRKYLREFLLDKRVIDIPAIARYALINGIIAPFRAPKSAKVYKELWTERGSPLLYHGRDLQEKLQASLGNGYHVAFGMRYQSPSIKSALEELREQSVDRIIVLPLFPQYASASTGSVQDKIMEIVKDWWIVPSINFISSFCDDPGFINAFAELGKQHMAQDNYDHVVFSYHGLPERHILKGSDHGYCKLGSCCNSYNKRNKYCYRAACFATSRLLAEQLGLREDQYTVAFQSRLGKDPWLQPYTDFILKDLPAKGIKKVLAYSPAFVADCLETTIEVGEEFKEMFLEAGGEKWQLVESLNSNPMWVEAVKEMILAN
ncbi:ferrochelatase [Pontibacter aydingkolensis]|uniref:Ferrochelatase n=1 Tax=Pontibacter aydingkolensis TaxID=1911536 RepID=A0ABS7CXP8_9BACT|nr:ferrochelatase [Pontibacter aydingkolensis]MBW7468297.1 ferrochelatase [Pontibacter aydingkolensis]